jgi:hypothetical protein
VADEHPAPAPNDAGTNPPAGPAGTPEPALHNLTVEADGGSEFPEQIGEGSAAAVDQAGRNGPAAPARRSLKLVVTLKPQQERTYRALLAVGADGCDPVWCMAEVAGLPAVLAMVSDLVAEAEARWQVQPRYPAASAGRSGKTTPPSPAAEDRPVAAKGKAPAGARPASRTEPKEASTDQLTLFG